MYLVLYVAGDASLQKAGPFDSDEEAVQWIRDNDTSNSPEDELNAEIDIYTMHVYIIDPQHNLREIKVDEIVGAR